MTNTRPITARRSSCVYAKIGGHAGRDRREPAHAAEESKKLGLQIGGVIYADSADKAAGSSWTAISPIADLLHPGRHGFMVGRDAEQAASSAAGAKLVNAMSNCTVPKITVIAAAASAPATTRCAAERSTRASSSPGPARSSP
jgi:acetyl-CoA carboxylase carboxyltransferase component